MRQRPRLAAGVLPLLLAVSPAIAQVTLDLQPDTLPEGTVGVPYNQPITASNGPPPHRRTVHVEGFVQRRK